MAKISFKRGPRPTGLSAIGSPDPNTEIKWKGKVFGTIYPPNWTSKDDLWKVSVKVMKTPEELEKSPNCEWRWATFAKKFFDEDEARRFILEHQEQILKMALHFQDD